MYLVSMKGLLQGLVLLQGPVLYCTTLGNWMFEAVQDLTKQQQQDGGVVD